MKPFIWMLCGIFVSGLLLGTLSACGAAYPGPAESLAAAASFPAQEEPAPAGDTELPVETPGGEAEEEMEIPRQLLAEEHTAAMG